MHGVQEVGDSNPLTQILFYQALKVNLLVSMNSDFASCARYVAGNAQKKRQLRADDLVELSKNIGALV